MDNALLRIPVLEETGLKKLYNGPESFTPDNQFILGEAPECANFFVAAGFNSVGIASAGGAGRALAEWIVNGAPTTDLTERGHPTVRAVQRQQPMAARPGRRDPRPALRNTMAQPGNDHGAALPTLTGASPAGRGRSQLRQPDGVGARQLLRSGRCRTDHRVLLGQAELAAVVGRRADQHPHRVSRCSIRRRSRSTCSSAPTPSPRCSGCAPPTWPSTSAGRVYTGMLNERGTYESDVTVTRTAADEFLIVSSAATTERDKDHIRKNLPPAPRAELVDVTSSLGGVRRDGTPVAGTAGHADRRRPVRRRLPVRHQPADLVGLLDRSRDPDHLRRRTRLGTLRSRGVRGRRVRGPDGRGCRVRRRARRLLRHRIACGWRRATAPSVAS